MTFAQLVEKERTKYISLVHEWNQKLSDIEEGLSTLDVRFLRLPNLDGLSYLSISSRPLKPTIYVYAEAQETTLNYYTRVNDIREQHMSYECLKHWLARTVARLLL